MRFTKKDIAWYAIILVMCFLLGDWVWVILALVTGVFLGLYAGVNAAVWATSRDRDSTPDDMPFNWRVLVGPGVYYNWLETRRETY